MDEQLPTEMTSPTMTVISFEVDTSETSSMFCCMVCQELIQSADDHRQCASRPGGDGCGGTICMPCVSKLDKRHCPVCGDKYPGIFVVCPLIKKMIYPRVSSRCPLGCGRSFLTIDSHMSECEHRLVVCPVCASETRVDDIFTHLNSGCKLPWGTCEITHAPSWEDAMISICANPGGTKDIEEIMCLTRINPKGEPAVRKNDRMIYAWREGDLVKMFCAQLCAAAGEIQCLGFDDDADEPVTCPVNSYAVFPGAIEMSARQFLELTISLGPGPWNLIIGAVYDVPTGDNNDPMLPDFIARNFRGIGTFRGKLFDVLWGPPRGVFVNQLGQTYMSNLNAQSAAEIKPVMSQTSSTPVMSQTSSTLAYHTQPRAHQMMMQPIVHPIGNSQPPRAVNALFDAIRDSMMGLSSRTVAFGRVSGVASEDAGTPRTPESEDVKADRESKCEPAVDNMDEKNDAEDDESSGDNESLPDLEMSAAPEAKIETPGSQTSSTSGSQHPNSIAHLLSGDPVPVRELRRRAIVPGSDAEIAAFEALNAHIMHQLDEEMLDAAIMASLEHM